MIHLRAWYEGHQTVSKLCEDTCLSHHNAKFTKWCYINLHYPRPMSTRGRDVQIAAWAATSITKPSWGQQSFVQFDDNFGFFSLAFYHKVKCVLFMILNSSCHLYSICIPLYTFVIQIIFSSSLVPSKKLKKKRKLFSSHHLPCHSPLSIFSSFPVLEVQERYSCCCYIGFCTSAPQHSLYFSFFFLLSLLLYSIFFFFFRKYYFIFCNLLFQEIFVNIIEIIRCPGCETWRRSKGILLANTHVSPGEDFSYPVASLVPSKDKWNELNLDLRSSTCYW